MLPVYILVCKYIFGCDAFTTSKDNTLKIVFATVGLVLLGFNYCFYSVDRINKLRHKFRESSVWGAIKLLLIFILFTFWIFEVGNLARLFFNISQC